MADSILSGGLTGIPMQFANQFAQQLEDERAQGVQAGQNRQGALAEYQKALMQAPQARTGTDSFNAIGEGMYASPNWVWNPAVALSKGFERMNMINDLRKQQAQSAPLEAAKVGYEDAKDIQDKYLMKQTLNPSGVLGLQGQIMRTMGATQRQYIGTQSSIFNKAYSEALKTAKGDEAVARAVNAANEALERMGVPKIDPNTLADIIPGYQSAPTAPQPAGMPAPGAPAAAPAPQAAPRPAPGLGRVVGDDRAVRDAEALKAWDEEIAKTDPSSPDYQALVRERNRIASGIGLDRKPVAGGPGENVQQRAERERTEAQAKAAGQQTGAKGADMGMKYKETLLGEANDALEANRSINEIDKALTSFSQQGKIGNMRKFLSQWKVALGVGNEQDIKDAANAEEADKLTFDLATKMVRTISPRGTQLELIRAAENNPNLLMSPEGAKKMISYLKQRNEDIINRATNFNDWVKQNNYQAAPEQWPSHDFDYIKSQKQRLENRTAPQPERQVSWGGKQISIKPYWNEKVQSLVADFPDGKTRKVTIRGN